MTVAPRSVVVGIFEDHAHAVWAIRDLVDAGFLKEDIGFAMRDSSGSEAAPPDGSSGLGAMVGGYTGAAAGGALGALLGAGIFATIPGLGQVLAVGMVGLALAGAYVGGIAGVLIGMGVPKEEAEHYHRHVEEGRALVAVKAGDRYSEALGILSADGAIDAVRRAEQTTV